MGLFRNSRREAWQQLCQETTAEYVERSFWKGDCVEMPFQNQYIVLDNYYVSTGKTTVVYTRIRTFFVRKDDFTFRICKKNIFSGISKALGANHIEIGDYAVDNSFVIKANDEVKIRRLFENRRLVELLLNQPQMDFQIKNHNKKNGNEQLQYI